jgi:leucyl/phenylalanyl-tRNA---protein transferase
MGRPYVPANLHCVAPPVEPVMSRWVFPSPDRANADGFVGFGADLEPGTVLAAYRSGIFPMPLGRRKPMAWWSPDPRGVLPLDRLRVSRSLRMSARRFTVHVDTAFAAVVRACAEQRRPGGWITPHMVGAYVRLHALGWAHSVEAYTTDGRLAGGLYGVTIGGLFAGESMFHVPQPFGRDASKVALVHLVSLLRADGVPGRLLDVQWVTPHLSSLGVVEVSRREYLRRLEVALALPLPPAFADP